MCNCTSGNLEFPRCAIAHLRSGAAHHPGMTEARVVARAPRKHRHRKHAFALRGVARPRVLQTCRPLKTEGAGNAGCPMHPQPGARLGELSMHTSIHSGGTGKHPAFPTRWFTAYSALFPGTAALLTPSSARRVGVVANLTPASGRQNHTASPSATGKRSSHAPSRPPHPAPRFVTIGRNAPCIEAGWREESTYFRKTEVNYFFARGLDRFFERQVICPSGTPAQRHWGMPWAIRLNALSPKHETLTVTLCVHSPPCAPSNPIRGKERRLRVG